MTIVFKTFVLWLLVSASQFSMTFDKLFCPNQLDKLVQDEVHRLEKHQAYKYKFRNHPVFNSVGYLEVQSEDECFEYILLKTLRDIEPNRDCSLLLKSSWLISSKEEKEFYAAFSTKSLENLELPSINSESHLQTILTSLAKFQAKCINHNCDTLKLQYSLENVAADVLNKPFFRSELENIKSEEVLKKAQNEINKLANSNILVRSIWTSEGSNVLLNSTNSEAVFLNVGAKHVMPPVYDALLYIFALSDESFRKNHFEKLTLHYFEALRGYLQNSEYLEQLNNIHAELLVNALLPAVKFTITKDLKGDHPRSIELQKNLLSFFKYPHLSQEDVYEVTSRKLATKEYHIHSFELQPLDEKNGHLGEYFHLTVEGISKTEAFKFTVFTKILIASADLLQEILDRGAGRKEYFFYNTLLPLYERHGLGVLLDFAPKCYLARFNIMVLEDLGKAGYKAVRPNHVLDVDGLKKIIGKLARFHACGLIVEELETQKNGKIFRFNRQHEEMVKESFQVYDGELKKMFDSALKGLIHVFKKLDSLTHDLHWSSDDLESQLRKFSFSRFAKFASSETTRNVINHGDLYIANMMFKFDNDGTIKDGILVDFQLFRYIPPCYELLFFIYISSTKETRTKHYKELLDYYYESFSASLKMFDLDIEQIITRKEFDEELEEKKAASLAVAFDYVHLIHCDPAFREEVFHDEEKAKYYLVEHREKFVDLVWVDPHYRSMITGIAEDIKDLLKQGY